MSDLPDILARICAAKRREIVRLKGLGMTALERAAGKQPPARGFRSALAAAAGTALIAEVKRASPSAGILRQAFDPVQIARTFQENGATAVSVLTDSQFFQGETGFLDLIRREVELPLLRKDFILDTAQVLEARALGADAYLLIVAALKRDQLADLMETGLQLGMDPLVEVHNESELAAAARAGAELIGINNRNLHTFEVNLAVTERLAPRVPQNAVLVAESGISNRADVERLEACGVRAVLVGETLMRAGDMAAATRELAGI